MSPNKEQTLQSTKSGKFESQRIEIAVFIHFQCSKTKVPISCTIFWVLFLAHQLPYLRLMNPLYGQCRYIITKNNEVTGIELQWLNIVLKKKTTFNEKVPHSISRRMRISISWEITWNPPIKAITWTLLKSNICSNCLSILKCTCSYVMNFYRG